MCLSLARGKKRRKGKCYTRNSDEIRLYFRLIHTYIHTYIYIRGRMQNQDSLEIIRAIPNEYERRDEFDYYSVTGSFSLFKVRISGLNFSIPNLVMHLWELFIIVILLFSIVNVWIPASPSVWVPIAIWVATIVYFILLITCLLTLPTEASYFSSEMARLGTYQRNDACHLWWGTLLHVFVSVFYIIFYTITAGGTLPIDPSSDFVAFLGQRDLHVLLVAGCMAILFTRPFANNIGLRNILLYKLSRTTTTTLSPVQTTQNRKDVSSTAILNQSKSIQQGSFFGQNYNTNPTRFHNISNHNGTGKRRTNTDI